MRDGRAGDRNAEDADLAYAGIEECEVRDVEAALVEDQARRRLHRGVARVAPVRAEPEIALDVELDSIRSIERRGRACAVHHRGSIGEDRDPAGAAVLIHRDAKDPVIGRIRDVEEALCPVEGDAVRTESGKTVRGEEWTVCPQRPASAR